MLANTIWADSFGWASVPSPDAVEYARVTPSVRLARWEDGHPERRSRTIRLGDGHWWVAVHDEHYKVWYGDGATRDKARAAALDKAESAVSVEGGAQ
jgi:hypothetical protein